MSRRTTKQRRAARRRTSRRWYVGFDTIPCADPTTWAPETQARAIAALNRLQARFRPSMTFVCDLPPDGFLQRPPEGVS